MSHQGRFAPMPVIATVLATAAGPTWGQDAVSGRTLHVNDIEMYVEVRGSGDPLVLLVGSATADRFSDRSSPGSWSTTRSSSPTSGAPPGAR